MGLGIAIRINGAPDTTADAAASVEVIERIGEPSTFRIEYALDISSGDLPLLKEDKLGPGSELSVIAPVGGNSVCLIKGPATGQHIHFEQGGSGSSLVVVGADSLIKLDREDKVAVWSDLTDSDAVSSILGSYGFTPDVEDTNAGHYEDKHTLIQRETDLAFISRLARRNGFFFWVTCDDTGTETAHFKRPELSGDATADLVINLTDPKSNVTALDLSWDVERPVQADGSEVDLSDKSTMTGDVQRSPLAALGGTALANIATGTRSAHVIAPVDDSGDLSARAEAALIEASFFARASGTTTLTALGKVLRAHTLVNLRGAGSRHSGLWYCSGVRHFIDVSEHTMEFELIRNGWNA